MDDSRLAEKRFYKAGFPSETSRQEEIDQVIRDYLYHDQMVQFLGPRKGFYHVIERARLEGLLIRYGAI